MADVMQGGVNADMIANINVDYTTPSDEEVLKYVASTGLWTPSADATSTDATQLQGVDIDTTSPSDLQHLVYINSTSKWTPTTPAGGGGKIVQAVSGTHEFYYAFSNNWQATGEYVSITPTESTNKIVGTMSLTTSGNNATLNEYMLNLYRDTSSASAGSSATGTQIFSNTTWPGGVQVWESESGNNILSTNFLCLNFQDDSYATTSTIYYNIAQRHISNSYPAYIVNNPWHWFLFEIDES